MFPEMTNHQTSPLDVQRLGQETLVETDGKFNPSRGTVPTVAELHVQQPGSRCRVAFGFLLMGFAIFCSAIIVWDSVSKKRVIQKQHPS